MLIINHEMSIWLHGDIVILTLVKLVHDLNINGGGKKRKKKEKGLPGPRIKLLPRITQMVLSPTYSQEVDEKLKSKLKLDFSDSKQGTCTFPVCLSVTFRSDNYPQRVWNGIAVYCCFCPTVCGSRQDIPVC